MFRSIEICAGAGGQALGLEQAGFNHIVLVEIDSHACKTLRLNRPNWDVREQDVKTFSAIDYKGIDLLAGGVPCPPFSIAGKQLGHNDERDLFPEMVRLTSECLPKAIMIENVRGLLTPKFNEYRAFIQKQLYELGYLSEWRLLNAAYFGVPQSRPRAILIGLRIPYASYFEWPTISDNSLNTVGEVLYPYMAKNGWEGASDWKNKANGIAPTIVGGSKKHGGPDLGPSRARYSWEQLGVDGGTIAEDSPSKAHIGLPRLTVRMAAAVQGFPDDWQFYGKKTASYRQVGNAFPPPVAKAVGESIVNALKSKPRKNGIRSNIFSPVLF